MRNFLQTTQTKSRALYRHRRRPSYIETTAINPAGTLIVPDVAKAVCKRSAFMADRSYHCRSAQRRQKLRKSRGDAFDHS